MQCYRGAIIRLKAAWCQHRDCAGEAACRPAVECYRRRQMTTTTDAREQNNTGHLHYV